MLKNIVGLSLSAFALSAAFAQAADAHGGGIAQYNSNWLVMDCLFSEQSVQFETASEIIPSRAPKRVTFRVVPEIFDSFWRDHLIIEDGQEFPQGQEIEVLMPTHLGDTPAYVTNIRIIEDIEVFSFPQYEIEVQAEAFQDTFNNLFNGGISPSGWVCVSTPYADRERASGDPRNEQRFSIR